MTTNMPISSHSDIKELKLGTIEGAQKAVRVKDYLEVVESKTALGRLFSQIIFSIQGKGWINEENTQKLVQNLDWDTIAKVDQVCHSTIEMHKSNAPLATSKELKENLAQSTQDLQIVATLFESEAQQREAEMAKFVAPLDQLTLEQIAGNELLKPLFDRFDNFILKTPDSEWQSGSPIHKNYQSIQLARGYKSQRVDSLTKLHPGTHPFIKQGFKEWLVEQLVENRLPVADIERLRDAVAPTGITNVMPQVSREAFSPLIAARQKVESAEKRQQRELERNRAQAESASFHSRATPLATRPLAAFLEEPELYALFQAFEKEFSTHLFSGDMDANARYFNRYVPLREDFTRKPPLEVASRYSGYFEGSGRDYTLSKEGKEQPAFKELFVAFLLLKQDEGALSNTQAQALERMKG